MGRGKISPLILKNFTKFIFMENLQSKENSHEWITKAIESSVTPFHFDGCQNLIRLFATKWEDDSLYEDLVFKLHEREKLYNYF
jgi:hypothetical protein